MGTGKAFEEFHSLSELLALKIITVWLTNSHQAKCCEQERSLSSSSVKTDSSGSGCRQWLRVPAVAQGASNGSGCRQWLGGNLLEGSVTFQRGPARGSLSGSGPLNLSCLCSTTSLRDCQAFSSFTPLPRSQSFPSMFVFPLPLQHLPLLSFLCHSL